MQYSPPKLVCVCVCVCVCVVKTTRCHFTSIHQTGKIKSLTILRVGEMRILIQGYRESYRLESNLTASSQAEDRHVFLPSIPLLRTYSSVILAGGGHLEACT